jgi:hypothetical protein
VRFDETDIDVWWDEVAAPVRAAYDACREASVQGAARVLLVAGNPAAAPDSATACAAAAIIRLAESLDRVDGRIVAVVGADPALLRSRQLRIGGGPW